MTVPLKYLLERDNVPRVLVTGITNDSRCVEPGDLFVAYRGLQLDGYDFVDEAFRRGAVAVCSDREPHPQYRSQWVYVPDIATRQGAIAARFYDYPSKAVKVVGITGTNGKTSVAYGIANVLPHTAFMGTLGVGRPPVLESTKLTTLDAIALQRSLARFREQKLSRVAMEVSSHGLDQGRVKDVDFDCAVFTNISRDHLDYHRDMGCYIAAKRKLFEQPHLTCAVINIDGDVGKTMAADLRRRSIQCRTFGTSVEADLTWSHVKSSSDTVTGYWHGKYGTHRFTLPTIGELFIANAAAILLVAHHYGLQFDAVVHKLESLPQIPGRMELISQSQKPTVVLDYAHTPEALQSVLRACRQRTNGRLICVFGCGGDRDRGKRPQMAQVAELLADTVYVTTDNPRFETPQHILDDIADGFEDRSNVVLELDRAQAIAAALGQATADDTVLVAGKGHEMYQEVDGQHLPYSDRDTIIRLLEVAN